MLYRRKWDCAVCRKPVIYDNVKQTLTCGCRVQPNVTFVNMEAFEPIPKYDRHVYIEKLELPLDCAKYVAGQMLYICDRNSIVKVGEDPRLAASWVYYPKDDKYQLKLAVKGNFHMESITYNIKDVDGWTERVWIHLDGKTVEQLITYLKRNPEKLHNWM